MVSKWAHQRKLSTLQLCLVLPVVCVPSVPNIANQLPEDTIHEILKYLASPLDAMDSQSFPWYLGRICSAWRATFLNMHEAFWSEIIMIWKWVPTCDYAILEVQTKRVLQLIDMFLERSRGLPFSVTWSVEISDDTVITSAQSCLSRLLEESTRWRRARITWDIPCVQLLHRAKGRFPLLESLELPMIRHPGCGGLQIPRRISNVFWNAPSLEAVSLQDVNRWSFNWSSLTVLRLGTIASNVYTFDTLSHATNLQQLEVLSPHLGKMKIPPGTRHITLPSLRQLKTHDYKYLQILQTPMLDDIWITSVDERLVEIIMPFLQRSGCSVRQLTVEQLQYKRGAFKTLLKLLPDLTHLTLPHRRDVKWLVIELPDTSAYDTAWRPPLLPPLRSVRVSEEVRIARVATLLASCSWKVVENGMVKERLRELGYPKCRDREALKWVCEVHGVRLSSEETILSSVGGRFLN
ncbi:hypothetical protein AX15_005921 [Amanita polypyramis BW_CC]|nr:hypothetical protein AX15_005921 [Amanita polypyramis BW_CC]